MRNSKEYLKRLANKIILETLEGKANEVVEKIKSNLRISFFGVTFDFLQKACHLPGANRNSTRPRTRFTVFVCNYNYYINFV